MKVLFTGGSSFTGFWFIRELAAVGHDVTAVFRKRLDQYSGTLRRQRVTLASEVSRPIYGCSFGDRRFLNLIAGEEWDLLCHHGADVSNYKSPDFDAVAGLRNNTHNLPQVLAALKTAGCRRLLLTGSIFEHGEGVALKGCPTSLRMLYLKVSRPIRLSTTALEPRLVLVSLSSRTLLVRLRNQNSRPIS